MKCSELLAEEEKPQSTGVEKDLGTVEIHPEGEGFLVKLTAKSGLMLSALYWIWDMIGKKKGVEVKIMTVKQYGKPQPTLIGKNDGMLLINKRPTKMSITGVDRETLQAAVNKAIAKVHKEHERNVKYKADAPKRKAEAAKYQAEKRKKDMAEYDKKYGKGTWKRITYRQEGGDDGYSYVVRVDGRVKWEGLTQREAMYYKEREADEIAKRQKIGKYATNLAEAENVHPADFSRGKDRFEKDESIEIPKGFERFDFRPTGKGTSAHIIGIKADGSEVIISTAQLQLAKMLVKLYNGGKTEVPVEKVSMTSAFGSPALQALETIGYTMSEKPSEFSSLDNKPVLDDLKLKKLEKLIGTLHTFTAAEIYGRRFNREDNSPQTLFFFDPPVTTYIIRFNDGARYLCDRTGARTYCRFWAPLTDATGE